MAALVVAIVLCLLGVWQLRRNVWRQEWLAARNAQIDRPPASIAEVLADPRAFPDRRATARGHFVAKESIAARSPEGGVRVLTPLALSPPAPPAQPLLPVDAASPLLLVDRGLVPGPGLAAFLAEDATRAPDEVEVTGLLVPIALQPVAAGAAPEFHRDWQRFDPARPDAVAALQAQLSRPLAPVMLQAEAGTADALPRASITRPVSPVDHVSYALFWFALAAAAAANWVAFGFHQAREASRAAHRATLAAPAEGDSTEGDGS
jgi:surfeit locus 1 family protein